MDKKTKQKYEKFIEELKRKTESYTDKILIGNDKFGEVSKKYFFSKQKPLQFEMRDFLFDRLYEILCYTNEEIELERFVFDFDLVLVSARKEIESGFTKMSEELPSLRTIYTLILNDLFYYLKSETVKFLSPPIKKSTTNSKIKWLGTPSQFGYIIDLLIQRGYLERPSANEKRSSYKKDAIQFMESFEIDTTLRTLETEISSTTNSLTKDKYDQIRIPPKERIS